MSVGDRVGGKDTVPHITVSRIHRGCRVRGTNSWLRCGERYERLRTADTGGRDSTRRPHCARWRCRSKLYSAWMCAPGSEDLWPSRQMNAGIDSGLGECHSRMQGERGCNSGISLHYPLSSLQYSVIEYSQGLNQGLNALVLYSFTVLARRKSTQSPRTFDVRVRQTVARVEPGRRIPRIHLQSPPSGSEACEH